MGKSFFQLLSRGKLTVLLFHKVPRVPGAYSSHEIDLVTFTKVLHAVSTWFRIIPLGDAVLGLRAGNLPDRAACITFDDGYADWLQGVVPVLESYQAHATFFLTSGQFSGLPMWNERILHAVASAPTTLHGLVLPGIELPPQAMATVVDKRRTVLALDQYFKYQEPAERERLLKSLERWAGVKIVDVPTMSELDLRAIHSKGFGIGSHTVGHPILACCTPALALNEMVQAREQLESIVGGKVTAFAYPNGSPHTDFRSEHVELVKQAGYSCAVTTHWGAATSSTSVFQIPRFTPWCPSAFKMKLQMARNLVQRPKILIETEPPQPIKVLMVAFHFPPQAGSSGVLRTLNFVKYLPQSEIVPTVITAVASAYIEQRNDLVASIPARTRVIRAFALDTARHLSVAQKYPLFLAMPDRWISWWPAAVLKGLREIRLRRPNIVWSTYPIATAHLIGGTLAKLSGLPWVADFRDPMVSAGYPVNKLHRRLWQKLEAYTVRNATACVFTTERAAKTYSQRYPFAAHKCVVIENGYDEDAFIKVLPDRVGASKASLLILHSGLIYPKDRDPSTFFAAVQALVQDGRLDRDRLCIRFRAAHHEKEVKAFANAHGLADIVEVAPPLPYRQALAEMMGADLLLVFQGSYFNTQIPAKIYEYIRAQRPILAVLDPAGDTAAQLHQFAGVYYGDIASHQDIQHAISRWLLGDEAISPKDESESNLILIKKYSRSEQAGRLGELLAKCSNLRTV